MNSGYHSFLGVILLAFGQFFFFCQPTQATCCTDLPLTCVLVSPLFSAAACGIPSRSAPRSLIIEGARARPPCSTFCLRDVAAPSGPPAFLGIATQSAMHSSHLCLYRVHSFVKMCGGKKEVVTALHWLEVTHSLKLMT